MIKKDFYNENYNCLVKLVITSDYLKTIKQVYKKAKIKENIEICEGEVVCETSEKIYLVINKDFLSWNTIFHEVHHLTQSICKLRNITDEEAQSWVSGWIGGKLSEFFKTKKIEPVCG